jgi:hypothetical protein
LIVYNGHFTQFYSKVVIVWTVNEFVTWDWETI